MKATLTEGLRIFQALDEDHYLKALHNFLKYLPRFSVGC